MLHPSNSGYAPIGGPTLTRGFQVATSSFSWTGVAGGGGPPGPGCAFGAGPACWACAIAATDKATAAAAARAADPDFVNLAMRSSFGRTRLPQRLPACHGPKVTVAVR